MQREKAQPWRSATRHPPPKLSRELEMKTAHYYAGKGKKFVVFGINGKFTIDAEEHPVSGKREANKLASDNNAKPWNF